MATQAMQRLPQFNSQNMSNTLWAFASLNHHPGSMLLKVLQRELVHKLPYFTAQGIENVLWAFATLAHHPGETALHVCSIDQYAGLHTMHTAQPDCMLAARMLRGLCFAVTNHVCGYALSLA